MAESSDARVLVYALFGGDSALTKQILGDAGIDAEICSDAEALAAKMGSDVGAVIVAEEALTPPTTRAIVDALESQPVWSDLPIIVSASERATVLGELERRLGARANVLLLARPVRVQSMLSAVSSALRARRRQFETRDVLVRLAAVTDTLRHREQEMRAVVENLPELAWTARADGTIDFYNQRWFAFTGASPDGMTERSWEAMHDPALLPEIRERWQASLAKGEPFEMEFPLRRADGVFRWFLTRVTPLRDETDRVSRWVGINVDIDDRRRAAVERELFAGRMELLALASEKLASSFDEREMLERFARTIVPTSASLVTVVLVDDAMRPQETIFVDGDPAREAATRALRERHGLPDGHPLFAAMRSGETRILSASSDLLVTGAGGVAEVVAHLEGLRVRSAIVAPLVARSGTLGAIVVGHRERTYAEEDRLLVDQLATRAAVAIDNARLYERAQRDRDRASALQGLAASFSMARTTEEVARVAVTEGLDAIHASRGFVGLLVEGDATLRVMQMNGFDARAHVVWERISMTLASPVTEAVRTAAPVFCESHADLAARYPHLIELRSGAEGTMAALPLVADGRTFGAIAFVFQQWRVLSKADRSQAMAMARLCGQAIDRAMLFELAQSDRSAAEAANRAKDEFLAMVSHELRTPLNAMLGWANLLRVGRLDEAHRQRALETIERNARGQAQLVDDLLDVSRIVTGKLRLTVAPVALERIVEAAMETLGPAAAAKEIVVHTDIASGARPVVGDPDRLQQVVWNLLSNAVKFTAKGGRVDVVLRHSESNVELVVRDTGAGIDPAFLPYVFERFRQHDGGSTRRYGGLGLGLAIAKHLVELHGGTISVASEGEGRGSTFTVRIPVSPLRVVASSPTASGAHTAHLSDAPALVAAPELAGLRVLAVDDEPDARALLSSLLERCDAVVETASNADEAFERLQAFRPDILLSDIGMPGSDGYDLIRRVRALPLERGGRTPAIALTAYARTEDRRKALLAGYQMHLPKPIEPAELLIVLANVSGRVGMGTGR